MGIIGKASLNANRCKLSDVYIPLSCFVETNILLLKSVQIKYAYNTDPKADKVVEGFKYTVIDAEAFSTFDILVTMSAPIITQEQIDACGKKFPRVAVSLDDTFVHFYGYDKGVTNVKITTSHIELVK